MKELFFKIDRCQRCGEQHSFPIDDSGHYSGPLPCDPTVYVELQVDAPMFRALIEAERAKVKH